VRGCQVRARPGRPAPSDTLFFWRPAFPGAYQEQRSRYTNTTGDIVGSVQVAYRTQRQGAELFGSDSTLTGSD